MPPLVTCVNNIMNEAERPGGHLVLDAGRYPSAFRHRTPGANVLAVLFTQTADAWRSTWRREVGWKPRREALITATDFTRSTSTAGTPRTQMLPHRNIALTSLERPVDADTLTRTILEFLTGTQDHETIVFVDALDELICDSTPKEVTTTVETLSDEFEALGVSGYFEVDTDCVPEAILEDLTSAVHHVHGTERDRDDVARQVAALKRDDPTNYGYAAQHWQEAKRGIETCSRNYPQARQIHDAIDDPETTPRTLGATLKAFVTLDVIDTWGDTVGATRYDLTVYDPDRVERVGAALESDC